MFSECDSKITRIFIDMIDYQKIHIYISNGFEFGRGNNGFFDMSTSCGEMFGHDIARSDQLKANERIIIYLFHEKNSENNLFLYFMK